MIFMLFIVMWGRIHEQTTNFEHIVHETWPRTCGRVVFKFYKKQTKSENHETCQDVMISYVEAVIKIWGGFAQVVTYDACHLVGLFTKSWNFFGDSSVCKHHTWQLVRNLLNFYHSLIWYHDILTNFMIFGLRLLFIEFKNNSTAGSWSCFVNKMFEIGGLFLDTASHYTK